MKRIFNYLLTLFVVAAFASCNDDFLETTPLDEMSEEAVWNDPNLIEAYVNDLYLGIGHGLTQNMMGSLTDEAQNIHNQGTNQVVASILTPSDLGTWEDFRMQHFSWDEVYRDIRAANIFLEKIEETDMDDAALKQRLIGEVTFLRAYMYHNLWRVFGGVPLITQVYNLDDDFLVERNTFAETVDFIVQEANRAAELLPLQHDGDNVGRATQGAAMALKSRVLLMAASDLYHDQSWQQGYSNPELVGYVNADRTAMWQAAQQAAKDVMDLGIYSLHKAEPAPGDSTAANYAELFLQKENPEVIMSRFFLQRIGYAWNGYNPGLHNGPNGYHNWGGNTPLQQLVDDYEMADGTYFSWDNPEHAASPYENRDPRFYASILYDGAAWRARPSDVIDLDPEGIIQTGRYEQLDENGDVVIVPGLDTRKGPVEDWNGSYTGYYLRKFIDPNIDAQFFRQEVPWPFFRYAEILLNYAEASMNLGQEGEARTYINMIRRRAGMPETNESGDDLVKRLQNERRVELAFEEARYFDVRRWMIAPEELSMPGMGIDIYAELNEDGTHTYTYTPVEVQDRGWKDRMYFLPIPEYEIDKNDLLIQNPIY